MRKQKTYRIHDVRGALLYPTVVCVLLFLVSSLLLDGGIFTGYVVLGVTLHWSIAVYIYARRRNRMTKMDVFLFQAGVLLYIPFLFAIKMLILAVRTGIVSINTAL